jgi:dTDP-4-amino-4,6-dideoxygalactose transaminase
MSVAFHNPVRSYKEQRSEIDAAIARVLSGGRYVLGPEVEAFEEAFAGFTGVDHAVGVATGTDALVLALKAAGVGAGDEVITAPNAGGYVATACVLVGASPVFADVREVDLTLDPEAAGRAVSPRTKAIVATHLFGSLADVAAFRGLADRHNLVFIEDCAQAHGATLGGSRAGSFGDIAAFSFYPTKNLGALGDGGMVVCRDSAIAASLRAFRQYGWSPKYRVATLGGMNSRLDPLQAAVLGVRLPRLDERNARRRELFERYERSLTPAGVRFGRSPGDSFVAHLCVVRVRARDTLRVALDVKGIGTDVHYPVLDCDQPAWRDLGWRSHPLPVTRAAVGSLLSLPLYPEMTDAEADEVVGAMLDCLEKREAPSRLGGSPR